MSENNKEKVNNHDSDEVLEELNEMSETLESLRNERDALSQKLKEIEVRHSADMQNAIKGISKIHKSEVLAKVVEISKDTIADLDILYIAIGIAKRLAESYDASEIQEMLSGLLMFADSIEKNLAKRGILPLEAEVGSMYNTHHHKATKIVNEAPANTPENTIMHVSNKGWKITVDGQDNVIRPAHVEIYKPKQEIKGEI